MVPHTVLTFSSAVEWLGGVSTTSKFLLSVGSKNSSWNAKARRFYTMPNRVFALFCFACICYVSPNLLSSTLKRTSNILFFFLRSVIFSKANLQSLVSKQFFVFVYTVYAPDQSFQPLGGQGGLYKLKTGLCWILISRTLRFQ